MSMIYHYTSINTLALILKNKTLRFNCLHNVDDMDEGLIYDFDDLKQHIFVSCWTYDDKENIALWNMYTPNMAGVRIGLPENLLNIETDANQFITNGRCYGPSAKRRIQLLAHLGPYPNKVNYCDFENKKYNKKLKFVNIDFKLYFPMNEFQRIGMEKSNQWDFQKECRFVLLAGKYRQSSEFKGRFKYLEEIVYTTVFHNEIDISHIDLPIKIEALNQMEILTGISCMESENTIIESLIRTYIPTNEIKIKHSTLKFRVTR